MLAAFFGNSPPSPAKYSHSSAQTLSQIGEAVGLIQSITVCLHVMLAPLSRRYPGLGP
jgi:hypothetical protein